MMIPTETESRPLLGITMGDPAGVGPELVAHLVDRTDLDADLVVLGESAILAKAGALIGWNRRIKEVASPAEVRGLGPGVCAVIDLGLMDVAALVPGREDAHAGASAVAGIRRSAALVAAGEIDAVVSGPVNKVSMNAAGESYPGQTEMYLEGWNMTPAEAHIMLVGGPVRCSLVTAHCSMREALDRLTQDRVELIARQAIETLGRHFGIKAPRVGVAGLNCHAGDGGLFGREEIDVINPVMARLRAEGIDISDAQPADALFHAAESGRYDAVIGMYHDQGVIPLKRHGYVTVIAGAPHIRTTCGHGTAFDIAWKNSVRPDLFVRAAGLARDLARRSRLVR